jgi:hypothetical protein
MRSNLPLTKNALAAARPLNSRDYALPQQLEHLGR